MKSLFLVLALVAGFAFSQFVPTQGCPVLWDLPICVEYNEFFWWHINNICNLVHQDLHLNRVRLVDHIPYMINVLQEVVSEAERRQWCNLKVPDLTNVINETVFDRHYEGTVSYTNGFLSSMQVVDIRQSGVDQIWSWNNTDETGTVLVRATLRMHDVALGYDVDVNLTDGHHRYTVVVTYPLVLFTFTIRKNVNTEDVTVEVEGSINIRATVNRIWFLPTDNTTDVLMTVFDVRAPEEGILAWRHVFEPITLDVYHNKVEFPRICYDCPVT